MNKKTVFKVLRIVGIIICIGIIIFESIALYRDQKEYQVAGDEYDNLRDDAVSSTGAGDEKKDVDYPDLAVNFKKLEDINSDVVAWLYFPCLNISYPVVKETEVDEYLYTTFDGQHNKSGCLFEDILSDENFCGMHDIIFGHNMKDKSMFGSLKTLYQSGNEHLLDDNPYVYVYTKYNVYQYKVFAYYITGIGSEAYSVVENEEQYDEFVKYIKMRSAYSIPDDIDFAGHNSILTLSTCSGKAGSNRRFVVHCMKVSGWEQ
ncbi:MAG: class B sortase [Butyrivibrio sp.]|nr:class B sortase [Butyrivibrio sp.]